MLLMDTTPVYDRSPFFNRATKYSFTAEPNAEKAKGYNAIDRLEDRRTMRKHKMIFERTKKGQSHTIKPTLALFQKQHGETSERRNWASMGFPERVDTILN